MRERQQKGGAEGGARASLGVAETRRVGLSATVGFSNLLATERERGRQAIDHAYEDRETLQRRKAGPNDGRVVVSFCYCCSSPVSLSL